MTFTKEGRKAYQGQLEEYLLEVGQQDHGSMLRNAIKFGQRGLDQMDDDELLAFGEGTHDQVPEPWMLDGHAPFHLPVRFEDNALVDADTELIDMFNDATPVERDYIVRAINGYGALLAFYVATQEADLERVHAARDILKEMKVGQPAAG